MTNIFSYNFDASVASGTVMTTANSPFKSYVQSGWTFSNAHLLAQDGGTLAGRCGPATTTTCGANNYSSTTPPWSPNLLNYYRFYAYIEALPSANTTIFELRNGSSQILQESRLLATGSMQIRNNAATQVAVSPSGMVTSGMYLRVEGMLDSTNNKQQMKVFIGNNVHGTTPDYDTGVVASPTGGLGCDNLSIGILNAATGIIHFDNLALDNAAYPGSVVQQPLTANAGVDQTVAAAATVTLSGSGNGGSGTYTYAWTQTGGAQQVALSSTTAANPTFKAPTIIGGTALTFQFTVTDTSNGQTATDTVVINVNAAVTGRFFTEYFESGANGASITKSNTGFTGFISTPPPVFSSAIMPPQGTLSAHFTTGATAANQIVTENFTQSGPIWSRFYIYLPALPTGALYVESMGTTGAGAQIRINTDGTVAQRNGSTAVWTSSSANALKPGRWYRMEHYVDSAAQHQQLRVYSGLNLNGSTPDYDSGVQTMTNPNPTFSQFGLVVATANVDFYMDAIALANDTWIGPTANPNTFNYPPTVTLPSDLTNAEPGSAVTLTATDSDSDGNVVTRLWTQLSGTTVGRSGSGTTTLTYTAPSTLNGDTAQFRYTATDDSNNSTSATMNVTTLPVTERAIVNGVEVPLTVPSVPSAPFSVTTNDVVYWEYGAPLRTDGKFPGWGAHEAIITANSSFDWFNGGRPGGDGPPFPYTDPATGLTYTAHNIWGQCMPIAGGMPAAHRDVRIQVDFPQSWQLANGVWSLERTKAQLGSLDGGYWSASGSYTKTTDWVSTEPNSYWRTEPDGFGYSFDCKPMTNTDGTPKLDTAIAHFFWNGYFPRIAIPAGGQVAIYTRFRLITDNPAVDLSQAKFIGAFSGDVFETTQSSVGSNGRNPALGMPRHKIIGSNWISVGFVTGSETDIRGYPPLPFVTG